MKLCVVEAIDRQEEIDRTSKERQIEVLRGVDEVVACRIQL